MGLKGLLVSRGLLLASALVLAFPAGGSAHHRRAYASVNLSRTNYTPFPTSTSIVGAAWTTPRYGPPRNQSGDILPTVWADDGNEYTLMDDGGTDVPVSHGLWRQSFALIIGSPPNISFHHLGDPNNPPPYTFAQIRRNPKLWQGPLGPYYSSGLVAANHVFFATQQLDWDWNHNGLFTGLQGIAYSTDHGQHWVAANKPFPAPLGNLSWVVRGQGGVYYDGYVYAIATEREFNASSMIMGRSRPDIADMTDPSQWQWVSGWQHSGGVAVDSGGTEWPTFSNSATAATPIASWPGHLTYPQMSYDSPLHQYLLTFTYSYAPQPPALWRNGSQLVILAAPHPWGPFSFVAQQSYFGPSNGYGAGFPLSWISRSGRYLWMKWAANFDGCAAHLDCSGGNGFNYRRIRLTLANQHQSPAGRRKSPRRRK